MRRKLVAILLGLSSLKSAEGYSFDIGEGEVIKLRRTTHEPRPGTTIHYRESGVYLRYENRAGKIAWATVQLCEPGQNPRHVRYSRHDQWEALNRAMAKIHGMSTLAPSDSRAANPTPDRAVSRPTTRRRPVERSWR